MTTATKTTKKTTAKKATRKAPANKAATKVAGTGARSFASAAERNALAKKVVTLRDRKKNPLSWMEIGAELKIKGRMAVRLYDSVKGAGAHYGLLEGKGGRTQAA